jgi:hypothetical protein
MNTMNRCTLGALAHHKPAAQPLLANLLGLAFSAVTLTAVTLIFASPAFGQTSASTEAAEKALQEQLQREALARQTTALPQVGVRTFPASAMRGFMEVQMPPVVIVNGTAERLSPGHRIRGTNNMLVMSGQLAGKKLVVNYVRNQQGELHEVWILNDREAQEERAGSGPVRNFRFESEAPEAKK